MKRININENKINIVFDIEDNGQIKLMHFSALPFNENDIWNEMFEKDHLGCFDSGDIARLIAFRNNPSDISWINGGNN